MTEIERLRADLKVIERYEERMYALAAAKAEIGNKIRKLEAEADPWLEAKTMIEGWRKDILSWRHISPAGENAVHLFDHLTAENARLEKRVAELEAALKRIATVPDCGCVPCRGQCDSAENLRVNAEEIREIARISLEGVKPVADMQPPFEGPIESIEPILDPARVLRTAIVIIDCAFAWRSQTSKSQETIDFLRRRVDESVKPYRLKGTDDATR